MMQSRGGKILRNILLAIALAIFGIPLLGILTVVLIFAAIFTIFSFKTAGRKIVRDVVSRKGRTLLVTLAIFIGVAGTIALFTMSDLIVSQLREDLKEDELAMAEIIVSINAGETPDNQQYLADILGIDGVTQVIGGIETFATYKLGPEDEDFEDVQLWAYSTVDEQFAALDNLPIEPGRIVDGVFPTPGERQVALEQRMAEDLELEVGDSIYFRILSENEAGDVGAVEAFEITGLVFHAYGFAADSSIYLHIDQANYIGGSSGLNVFKVRFDDYEDAIEDDGASDQVEAYLSVTNGNTPYQPVFTLEEDPAQNQAIVGAQTISATMGVLALLALLVSGFLVINVITSIVVEQKGQIGVMKSMGASRADSFVMYSGVAFIYGLIAVILGAIVGIPAGYYAADALAPSLNTLVDGFQVSPSSIILGVVLGLAIPVGSSIIPVFLGTRVTILEAMTDLGISVRYGSGPIARFIGALPLPITIRQGLSNVSIKKSRLLFTVITLTLAVGAFMGIYHVFDTLTTGINEYIDSFNLEIGVFPTEGRDPEEVIGVLDDNFRTEDRMLLRTIEPGFQSQAEFEGYESEVSAGGPPVIFIFGYDTDSNNPAFSFELDRGERITSENRDTSIILSTLLASNMGKDVGDTVVLEISGTSTPLTVVGIAEFPVEQVYMDWRTVAKITGSTIGAPRPNEYFTAVQVDGYSSAQDDGSVAVLGLDLAADLVPGMSLMDLLTFSEGSGFVAGEPGIIVNQAFSDNSGLGLNDMVTLTARGEDGASAEYPIVGIFEIPPMMQQGMEQEGQALPEDILGIYWQDLATLEGISLEGAPAPQGYFILTNLDDPTEDEVEDLMDEMTEVLLANGISSQQFNFVGLINQISDGFQQFQIIMSAVAGLIALVGALGLLTTLSMSVFERQKEIGVMRSVGAGSTTIALQFLTEGLVVGIIAWVLGLPLSLLIERLLLGVTGFSDTFPMTFAVPGALIGLAGMIFFTTIASVGPSLSAARKTVSDILRYQ